MEVPNHHLIERTQTATFHSGVKCRISAARGMNSPSVGVLFSMTCRVFPFAAAFGVLFVTSLRAEMPRIWLTHQSNDPAHIVVNWETAQPAGSVVNFGLDAKRDRTATIAGKGTLHHVEITIPEQDVVYHYSVGDDSDMSPDATFKGYPTQELRVAVVGDWGYAKGRDLSALKKDDVHLLITAGDNVPS
ncbi:MAG: hypothetical protein JWO94_1361, partial [Verrucomicrobiaceae bacterium]|nr:hypothetical protein [Verrucomicrobiaceae bacterium]